MWRAMRRSGGFGDLHGAAVLLTGAGGALGGALADAFVAEGARLILSDLDASALEQRAARIREQGGQASVRAANLLENVGIDGLVEAVEGDLGPVDVLVSNAGIETNARFDRLTREDIDAQLGIHLRGPVLLTHALVPGMIRRGRGRAADSSARRPAVGLPADRRPCPRADRDAELLAPDRGARREGLVTAAQKGHARGPRDGSHRRPGVQPHQAGRPAQLPCPHRRRPPRRIGPET